MCRSLKEVRKERGFTQAQVANMLGYKDKSSYCLLENGVTKMTIEKAKKLSDIFGIDLNFFNKLVEENQTKNSL